MIKTFFSQLLDYLNIPLFVLGKSQFTLWSIVYILILLTLLFYLTAKMRVWVVRVLRSKKNIDVGVSEATGSIVRYVLISIGFLMILQSAGVDLSAITVLAGALGIGVGFGLQNITSNFVSGIIILFERPIKVGDRIEVNNILGDVVNISPRATTIVSNDNISIIVPNSEFISSTVINWSHTDRLVRYRIPVGVSYDSDPEAVRDILLEAAAEHPGVLKNPEAQVLLDEFADSALIFILSVWTNTFTERPLILRSELNYIIFKKLKAHGVEIPFPQRDLHIRSGEIKKDV
ncbi:Potassium efflux system KefA protein / Small-conductance mechanosensitive channel [hydrothermal vent metagenome]|uniref:Potassium efflux system KefA protein / Small-conductance mechanosensitive channel n=1 Tax=hydrothermal vent metagenome TaxID=652676 RepID=A0A3B1CSN0_9ZZZZ